MTQDRLVIVDQGLLETARRYKSELLARMFADRASNARSANTGRTLPAGGNVVGVGYGAKVTAGGGISGGPAVRVYVRAKAPAASLSRSEAVPREMNGLPTDVIAVGDVAALARPVPCGVSVGHYEITAGTLGCLVARRGLEGGDRFILSNNHVLANSNEGSVGDPVLEPGPTDGGDPDDPIAELTDFEPVDFSGPNSMDAAVARLLDRDDVRPEIPGIGRVQPPVVPAALYQSVRKRGRTTLHTVGVVMDLAADIDVRFGRRTASFEDQIAVTDAGGPFSSGGDSGSLVVDAVSRRPVALLFAGGLGTTFANPIAPVLDRFDAEIL